MTEFNRHHVVHHRQEWTLRPAGEYIREQPSLIKRIERPLHNEIHRECPPIPLLGHYALLRTAHLYVPGKDTGQSIDNLCFAIEEASKHPKAYPLERDLGDLAIEALQMQKPFLTDCPDLRAAA